MRNKTKSKQIRPQSTKLDVIYAKRTQQIKMSQKLQHSPLRPMSQDYHASLNHHFLPKNYIMSRNNLSSEKKNRRAKDSLKGSSNDLGLNNFEHEDEFPSKQRVRNREIKSRKENIVKRQNNTIKQKDQKDGFQVRTSNKEKQKGLKQLRDTKTKFPSFKGFIGSKLRRKLQSYLLFVSLINYSIRIRYKAPENRRYTVYIGKGNNSKLVKKIFGNRFWWNVVTKESTNKQINLVWSQWSKPNVFRAIPKTNTIQKLQEFAIDEPVVQQENKHPSQKTKTFKNKEAFLKKLTPQTLNKLEHMYDLFESVDKKLLFKKASRKQLKYETIKQLTSKESMKEFRKMKVGLTHNHIENHQQFTNKKNLFLNLKNFYKDQIFDIVPLTYHVTDMEEKQKTTQNSLQTVLDALNDYGNRKQESKKDRNLLWIVKPGQNSNRGCGIEVFRKIQQIKTHVQKQKQKHPQRTFIIQKYINPFLYHRRKFDIRCYLLVAATPQIRAYYYPIGYIRTSSCEFTTKNCSNKFIHLTNDAIQKKQTEYGKYEKGNKVTYEEFQKYLDLFESKRQLNFWKQILPKMQQVMLKTVKVMASKNTDNIKLLNPQNRQHSFELYGYDFMIDENFIPWLIEINTNPCIETGCEILQDIIPDLLQNVVKICVDTVFAPPRLQEWPLNEILACSETIIEPNIFQLIYSECQNA